MNVRALLVGTLAHVTRRIHPRGTDRILRLLHSPDHRDNWSVETIVPIGDDLRASVRSSSFADWRILFYGADGLPEPEVAGLIRRMLRPGGVAIDVGANLGFHTLEMSRAVRFGVVDGLIIACEPHPNLYMRLCEHLRLNGVENVLARQVALIDAPRLVTLHVPRETAANQGASSLASSSPFLDGAEPIEVEGMTLDALVDSVGAPHVDLIKIDVEGFEAGVIAGGRQCLARDRPVLVFEYLAELWQLAGAMLDTVIEDLCRLGYRRFVQISVDGLLPIPSPVPAFMNVVALPAALGARSGRGSR